MDLRPNSPTAVGVYWRRDDWFRSLGLATVSRVGSFRGARSIASG